MDTITHTSISTRTLPSEPELIPGNSSVRNLVSEHANRKRCRLGTRSLVCFLYVLVISNIPLISASTIVEREKSHSYPTERSQKGAAPSSCETNITILSAAHQASGRDGLLIVIARLGDGERDRKLSYRRLHNVRTYLSEYVNARSPGSIITAEGEPAGGLGRVELYVAGKLFHVLTVPRNGDLLVGSCYYEIDTPADKARQRNLYPWLDRRLRGSTKKR